MNFEITIYRKILSKKNKMKVFKNRTYKTSEVKDFENYVSEICYERMKELKLSPSKKEVSMELDIVFGDKRKRDLQNCWDCVCDALNTIVYEDDSQIVSMKGSKRYEKNIWKFDIRIKEI